MLFNFRCSVRSWTYGKHQDLQRAQRRESPQGKLQKSERCGEWGERSVTQANPGEQKEEESIGPPKAERGAGRKQDAPVGTGSSSRRDVPVD